MPESIAEFRRQMWRRVLIIAVAIAVSGLLPLIANGGSCTAMPCCHKTTSTIASTVGCCGPATCVKQDEALQTTSNRHAGATPVIQLFTFAALIVPSVPRVESFPTSPPRGTSERLSVLSVLLI